MKITGQRRKAISPIVATVLIIAATLIAFAAVLGYIFGIFGSSTSTANLTTSSVSLSHTPVGTPTPAALSISCPGTAPAAYYGTAVVSNTGSANGAVTGVTLTYSGNTASFTLAASCSVVSGGTTTFYFLTIGTTPPSSAGASFNGYFTTSAGSQVSFTGTFS